MCNKLKMWTNSLKLLSVLNKIGHYQTRLIVNHTRCTSLVFQSCRFYNTPVNKNVLSKPTSLLSSISPKEHDQKQEQSSEDEEVKRQRENSWRAMKYTLIAFGVSFTCFGCYTVIELGKPPMDDNGNVMIDEFTHLPVYKQYFYRTLRELDYYKRMIREPSREKLLPDVLQYPYYQPPYTLVLEMTDILVHPDWTYQTGWRFKKRPGIDHFLESLNGIYEIVIFTAEQGMTVFPLIEALDPNNIISYKLVRDATHFIDGHHVKDLSKLNRDLNKVIVVDWNVDSVRFQPQNLFHLPRWAGNDDDNTLIDLAAFLRTIAQSDIDDVRDVLSYYNQFENPLNTFREKQKQLMELQEADRQSQETKSVPVVKRWTPNLFKKNM